MSKRKLHWNRAAAREAERLSRIAEQGIPTLQPITTRVRLPDPAIWGDLS